DNVREQFDKFRDDESDDVLKILLCIDMLNEGVHIKGIDGVIMLRSTRSGNVFYQQLGRALSCSKSKPVIFDLVNNYETGDTAREYADIMKLGRTYCADERETDITFEIYDYARDIRTLLDDIYSTFDTGWENSYDLLCEFIKEYGRFPCGRERYRNYTLGDWCIYQRMLHKKNRLSPDKVKKLDEDSVLCGTRQISEC
ncbi:MAG: Helicase associated domain protein, partial [Oscillospiraceae bacterium]|nr:Helicase associated domain protein [Oscillospiraceae bacterium]